MKDKAKKIDIRILKYTDYVKKHPQKAYGFYCLGKLYMESGEPGKAENFFSKALDADKNYIFASIGLVGAYVYNGRFLKAVNHYNKYYSVLCSKKIYGTRLVQAVTASFGSSAFDIKARGLITQLIFRYEINKLKSLLNNCGSTITPLILCMYYLSNRQDTARALEIYNMCVFMNGLNNNLRWEMIKRLSESDSSVLKDTVLAQLFTGIPLNNCTAEYTNTIVESILKGNSYKKIESLFKGLGSSYQALTPQNLWNYINWCKRNSIYNSSVLQCCRKLIKSGWVDKMLAETFGILKEMRIADNTEHDDRILELYGYRDKNYI